MIDIHTHILPSVDDGSKEVEKSLEMLKNSVEQGITKIILTPHYRRHFNKTATYLKSAYESFCKTVKEAGIDVELYLGQEIYYNSDIKKDLSSGKLLTMNDTKYLLVEFSSTEESEVADAVYELKNAGYIPIVAHVERYEYLDIDDIFEIVNLGGYIQVNAESFAGDKKKSYKKIVKKLFKENLVDFVASDIHENRTNCMQKAKLFVEKKYGVEIANKVFIENANKIIEG